MGHGVPILDLDENVQKHLNAPDIAVEVKLWARRRRADVRSDMERIIRDDGYRDFLLSFIQQEAAKVKAHLNGDPHDHPYDGTRTRPVCTCDGQCPLKRGELPKEFRDAPSVDTGARQFRHAHRGHPLVIDDGREAFARLVAYVEDELVCINIGLANGVRPTDDEWPDDAAPNPDRPENTAETAAIDPSTERPEVVSDG